MSDSSQMEWKDLQFGDTVWLWRLISASYRTVGLGHINLPVVPKQIIKYLSFSLAKTGNLVGFSDPDLLASLKDHYDRLQSYTLWVLSVTFGIAALLTSALIIGAIALRALVSAALTVQSPVFIPVFIIVLICIMIICLGLSLVMWVGAFRLAAFVVDKRYADTLCIIDSISAAIELTRDDVLIHPAHRRALLDRLNHLARSTRLLALRFSDTNRSNQAWLTQHFTRLEQYIRQRERWTISPTVGTLDTLRRDLQRLAVMYTLSQYGDFDWASVQLEPEPTINISRGRRLALAAARLLGIVVPIIVLALMLADPAHVSALGLNGTALALILIAWFLLAIDATLGLGIVERIANMAKAIKDLQ
jgi:hypothetical protein